LLKTSGDFILNDCWVHFKLGRLVKTNRGLTSIAESSINIESSEEGEEEAEEQEEE